MHELSLCINMLKILEKQVQLKKFNSVTKIWLDVGRLASVEKEALLMSFPIAAKNTIAEHAQLNIIDMPGKAKCLQCQVVINVNTFFDACPFCGKFNLDIISGMELRIDNVEVS